MALFGTGVSTKFWRAPFRAFSDMGGRPIWLSVWSRGATAAAAGNQGLACFGTTGSNASAGPYIDTSAGVRAWDENDAGSFQQSAGGGTSLATTWQHWFASYPSATSRTLYGAGAATSGTDASTLAAPQTFNSLIVGTLLTSVLTTTRSVAEVVFGRGTISTGQILALYQGMSPLEVINRSQILGYFPLRGDLFDYNTNNLRSQLHPIGGAAALWDATHPNVALPRRARQAFLVATGVTTVFFSGLGRSVGAGRTTNTQSTAIVGRTAAGARLLAAPSPSSAISGSTSSLATGRALASPAAPLAARTQADAAGRASPAPSVPLAARTEGIPAGRASTSLAAPSTAKSSGRARGSATAGGVSQLSGSARTGGAAAGRAAASPSAALSSRTQAGSRASATAGGLSQLSALARTAGLATGRAAPLLGAALAGRARGGSAVRASPSPSTAAVARTQAGARGMSSAGGVSALSAAGATRGRAAGRAAIALSAPLSASTISRGAMRSGLSAGTALTAVARSMSSGRGINGDQNPVFFHAGRVATIRTDGRLAILPVDTRVVTVSGST
jgi:hypothetical protein